MTPFFSSDRGSIYKARAEAVYPLIDPGSVSLVISDGPYNMRKAEWDKFASWDAFVDWYRPHIAAWSVACAPSATVYVWGSDEGEGYLRAPMRKAGWTFKGSVVWNKIAPPLTLGRSWPEVTERTGVWMRGAARVTHPDHSPRRHSGEHVPAVTNVWALAPGAYVRERLKGHRGLARDGSEVDVSLHPCQKPLAFYDRIIRASSRPGELVLEPYGGTCRAAVACERLPRAEARRYVCVEPDEDGRGYLDAILPQLRYDPADDDQGAQPSLFGETNA